MTYRAIKIEGTDIELELNRVTAIKADVPFAFHVDRTEDGKYRLTYNAKLIPDITKVAGFTIIRQD